MTHTAGFPSRRGDRALAALVALWAAGSLAAIEIYSWRYIHGGAFPGLHLVALVAALAAAALVTAPHAVLARLPCRRPAAAALGLSAAYVLAAQIVHVAIVCAFLGAILGLAWGLGRVARRRHARVLAIALPLSAGHLLVLAYYAVLFLGLESWNQVISIELIVAYTGRTAEIARLAAVGWLPYALLVAVCAVVVAAYAACAPRLVAALDDLAPRAAAWLASSRRRAAVLAVGAGGALVGTPAAGNWLLQTSALEFRDPLATTLFVEQKQPLHGNMALTLDPLRDRRDRSIAAQYAAPGSLDRRTIVVITVDALRADQMAVYGHPRPTTPFLSRLYAEGRLVRFDDAFSVCVESFCGLMGIFASRYWHEVGPENFTLTDALAKLGYRSHFLLSGDHTSYYGLRRFYGERIDEYRDGLQMQGSMHDDEQVVRWLREIAPADGVPRFIFVHLMSTHWTARRMPEYRRWTQATDTPAWFEKSVEAHRDRYHNAVLQADGMIERLFAVLAEKNLLDDAVVVITADHGERLGERGKFGHVGPPNDWVLRVPMLIHDPHGAPAYRRHELVSTIDVAPTLLERIGAPVPAHWSGRSLLRPDARRLLLAQGGPEFAVLGRWSGALYKYHYRRDNGAEALFNVTADPLEERPLAAAAHPGIVTEMRAALDAGLPRLRAR